VTTTYRGYNQPTVGTSGWDTAWNTNWDLMDADLGRGYTPAGLEADLPTSPTVGDTYIATDTGIFYKCLTDGVWTGVISANEIPDGAIDAGKLQSGAVTSAALAANSVVADKIAAGAIGGAAFAAGAVDQYRLASGAVGGAAFAAGAVGSSELATGAVDNAALAAASVTTAKIAGGVTTTSTTSGAILTRTAETTLFKFWQIRVYGTNYTYSGAAVDDFRELSDFALSLTTTGGILLVSFQGYFNGWGFLRFNLDGVAANSTKYRQGDITGCNVAIFDVLTGVSAGSHVITPAWSSGAAGAFELWTAQTNTYIPAYLNVLELKR